MPEEVVHDNHPGVNARDCEHSIRIGAVPGCFTMNGYACSVTGGHCVPSQCRVKDKGKK